MSTQNPRNLIIGAAAILGALGIVTIAFGVPAISAKYAEITASTLNNVRQDADIRHNSEKIDDVYIVLAKIAENSAAQLKATNAILVSQARFETNLATWEPSQ